MTVYIGIDNGADGAIAAFDGRANGRAIRVDLMPTLDVGVLRSGKRGTKRMLDHAAILGLLRDRATGTLDGDVFAVLEKAQPFPKEGIATSFNAGASYGAIQMALTALRIPFEIVPPKMWQAIILKGVDGTDTKMRAILKARRTFPDLDLTPGRMRKPHTGIADAACMALYAAILRPVSVQILPPRLPPPPPRP